MNNESESPTGTSKHSKTINKKRVALVFSYIIHCFLVFGYPGETLALVVHILHGRRKQGGAGGRGPPIRRM